VLGHYGLVTSGKEFVMSQVTRRFNRTPGRPDVIRVLLVDDVENVRQTLREILATYPNFEVLEKRVMAKKRLRRSRC